MPPLVAAPKAATPPISQMFDALHCGHSLAAVFFFAF